ncbi:MAG: hypothetical protein AAF206_18355, partial [Bacteroidota bacterium]
ATHTRSSSVAELLSVETVQREKRILAGLAYRTGDFSNGITSIQCMYAPEFSSHSEGIRVEVRE